MAYLIVREPGRVAFTAELGDECTVGRDPASQVVVSDRLVSRQHLRIARGPGGVGWLATNLSATHGTFVNAERISAQALRDRDQIQAGSVIIIFRDEAVPRPDASFSVTDMGMARPRSADAEGRRLRLLYDVSRAIGALDDPQALMATLLDGVLEVLNCERGVVCLVGQPLRVTRARGGAEADDLVLSQTLLDAMLQRNESAIVRGTGKQSPPAMGTPLLAGGRAVGFIYVAGGAARAPFTTGDLEFLTALAHLTSAALAQSGEQRRLRQVVEALGEERSAPELIGESEPMVRLRARIEKFGRSDASVLIRGESGTGKELVARAIHAQSPRAEQPFVAVNCAAIPETLIESELFGHEKGAFTGALKRRRGKFALADGGTLFLDEIGDLDLSAQAKLLRAIEEGEIHPVGAEQPVMVDVRLLSATHKPLEDEIAAGRFRSDLYYRLNVVEIGVPPLRQRGEDVVLLAERFLARAAKRLGTEVKGFAPGARETLRSYQWPGNVRQLANEVERALLLADGPLVDVDDLRSRLDIQVSDLRRAPALAPGPAPSMEEAERHAVVRALDESGGNIQAAAKILGISRATLYRRIVRYRLVPDE